MNHRTQHTPPTGTHPTGSSSRALTAADWQTAHEAHCTSCRSVTETLAAGWAANAASTARRDRRQLALTVDRNAEAPRG